MNTISPERVLMFYDFPQVFIGKDIVDANYACMIISEDETGPRYSCVPISAARKQQLSDGSIDLRSVFEHPEIDKYYEIVFEGVESIMLLTEATYSEFPLAYLPEPELRFDGFDEVASKAVELNTAVAFASLSVAEAETAPRIHSNRLAEFLAIYQNAIKYLTKLCAKEGRQAIARGDTPFNTDVFGFSHGSFTVQLRSSYDGDILGDNALLSLAFDKLNSFLDLTENAEGAIEYLQSIKGHTASSLIKLLVFLNENSCPLRHQWANPQMGESRSSSARMPRIKELVELCRQRDDLISEQINLIGNLTIANSDANTWKLLNESDGRYYSGDVDPRSNITMHGLIIGGRYKFLCQETIEVVLGTGREIKKLSLYDKEHIA